MNIAGSVDSFKVEVAMPGMKREEFLIHANENILSICAVPKEPAMNQPGSFQLPEFNYECFDRHIVLRENVDAAFVSAE